MYIVIHALVRGTEKSLYNSKFNFASRAKGFLKLLLFKSNLHRNKDAPFKYLINIEFQRASVSWGFRL